MNERYLVAKWMLEEWHPRPSMFERLMQPTVEELRREGDALRRKLENKRILECTDE